MDVRATKDHYERETEETERLVRPAPKVKPPRDDKKREDVRERDPDTDGDPDLKGDPDMSVNYKNVGGSLADRVLARFATEPKDEQDKPKSHKWVKVRNKELDVGTRVRPNTLMEEPSLYEKTLPNEPPERDKGKPRPARKPERPHYHKEPIPHPPWPDPRPMPKHPPRPVRPPKPVKPVPVRQYPEPENPPEPKPPGWVPERRKPASTLVVARFLEAREFPSQEALTEYLKAHPDADPKEHTVKETEERPQAPEETSGQQPAGEQPPKTKEKKPKKEDAILQGVVPEEKPKAEESATPSSEEKPKEKGKGKDKGKEETEAPKGPQPKRRKPSKEELEAMKQDIATSFSLAVGSKLLAANLHPDDYQRIKASAAVAAQVPLSMDKLDERVEELRQLPGGGDPSKVPPPKQAKNREGEMVPFESLPKEEQAEAWAQFRNEVVAAHIGAQAQVATTYRKAGMPDGLSRALTQAKFGQVSPDAVWERVLETGERDHVTPKSRARLIDKLKSDQDKALATRFFQGQDYLDVRDQFLNPTSESGVSEFSSSTEIKKALQMGSAMLAERAKAYPEEFRDPNVASQFRWRILRKLEALDPHKATIIQKAVDDMDADDYERATKEWRRQDMEVKYQQAKRDQKREKLVEKFQKEQADGGYRDAPQPSIEERIAEAGLEPEKDPVPPVPPRKPARYDLTRGNVPKARDQHKELFEQMEPAIEVRDEDIEEVPPRPSKPPPLPKKTKKASVNDLSARIVGRFLAFSTCAG